MSKPQFASHLKQNKRNKINHGIVKYNVIELSSSVNINEVMLAYYEEI
jgi:hypothetical protein